MKHTIFRLTFAALTLSTAMFWQTAQPASANEYICTDRNSGDWFTTDRDQSSDRGNITCRDRRSSFDRRSSDRQDRDRNYSNRDNSDWNYSDRSSSGGDYSNRDNSGYSDNNSSRNDYTRGYDDACAHNAPEGFANSRGYAAGYQDGLQRCDRPQRWDRNAAH